MNFNFMLQLHLPAAAANWQDFFFILPPPQPRSRWVIWACLCVQSLKPSPPFMCAHACPCTFSLCVRACFMYQYFHLRSKKKKKLLHELQFHHFLHRSSQLFFSSARVHVLNKIRLFFMLRACVRLCACLRVNGDWQVTLRAILSCWERKRRQPERDSQQNCRENLPTDNYASPSPPPPSPPLLNLDKM